MRTIDLFAGIGGIPKLLEREKVLAWFGNDVHYTIFYEKDCAEDAVEKYIIEK